MKKIILTFSILVASLFAADTVHYDKRVVADSKIKTNYPVCKSCSNSTIKTNHPGK